ncbi:MAG TPA: VCBS repeat-containing protein [Sedimentisphaerales bacterium]|nr:VCBS repeat-containing protein [Sedimentisphaerales bacterium]
MVAVVSPRSVRRLVLLLVVSTSCPVVQGDFRPEQQVITTEAAGATCVYAADLDGDGDLDVLSASEGDDKIAWYANDGAGRFGPQQVITREADYAQCVYAADLDSDGDLDVLSASWRDNKIAWYANDGTGQFGPQQVITTEAYVGATCVYAADLDGDGDLDVLSAREYKIAWYANDGSGRFGPQQVITTEAVGATSYAADLDDDGDLDVLSAGKRDGRIAWYVNDGSGQFGSRQVITTAITIDACVCAADLDGDGDMDVLSASAWDNKIACYANDGSGRFSSQRVIATKARPATCVHAADLDGDGDLDVLAAGYTMRFPQGGRRLGGWVACYANDGLGQFSSPQVITTDTDYATYATCVYAADLDGDGDLDVLSASYYYLGDSVSSTIAWYANDGTGQFGSQQVITTEADWATCVYAADLDGDGDLDVLSASEGDDKIAWYANDGTGHFGPQEAITTEAVSAQCVYAADLDGDGDLDVLSASNGRYPAYDGEIAWHQNDGAGQFGSQQVIGTKARGANSVYAADLDGDGDLDVLSASYVYNVNMDIVHDSEIAWYMNDGSGQFGARQVISTAAVGPNCVYAADLDGDGDMDVLSSSWDGGQIAWYENE